MAKKPFTTHHRKPRSIGGTGDQRNISHIPCHKHEAWHLLFANRTAHEIADEINEKFLDPDFRFVAVPAPD